MGIGELFTVVLLQPMLNALLLLYGFLGSNFALTVIGFTIIVRTLMLPLTLRQLHSAKKMTSLQPKMQDLQKRYKNDREGLSKATMELYKENGVSPIGCLGPTLLQFPIWIGLYQSLQYVMADRPDNLFELGRQLYPWLNLTATIPLNNQFLWLNLSRPDPIYLLPILVAGSTWLQQKMMTMPSSDPQQAQMNQMMGYMMPVMMGFFTINFPSGLALYWLTSNLYSIVTQYFVTGWGSLRIPGLIDGPNGKNPAPKKSSDGSKPSLSKESDSNGQMVPATQRAAYADSADVPNQPSQRQPNGSKSARKGTKRQQAKRG